jgi:hypothetical protein
MESSSSTKLRAPARRPLRVYAFDPSRGRLLGNEMQLDVRYRRLGCGPVDLSGAHDKIAVVDYDGSRKRYYEAVDLDDPFILIPNGMAPSETDPRFHQQMVYAVASDTIEQFESALGRRIHWRRAERPLRVEKPGWLPDDILTLTLFPHAMCDANAFYSPDAHGILFGYFRAGLANAGNNIPGQTVFTCLSHDIIVHEMTHAIVDGLRKHFLEQTNPDVAAFHEGFADLAALFRHFSHREVLLDAIQRSGGRLYTPALKGDPLADQADLSALASGAEVNPLIELAAQFGEASGMQQGLRSAIGQPRTIAELRQPMDCHERGSILVSAVFEAFFTVYLARAAKHFRVYRSGGGTARDDLPTPLADALCAEATRTASQFFRMCARALDYLPPVDVTFGDFLRAVLTAESDYDCTDSEGICNAWMQAFRRRNLLPDDAAFFSLNGLCWQTFGDDIAIKGLPFGGPLGLGYQDQRHTAAALQKFINANKRLLRLDERLPYTLPSFHPLYRVDSSGSIRWDLIVEVVQTRNAAPDGYPMRGGTTLIVSTHGTAGGGGDKDRTFVRYIIAKPMHDAAGRERAVQQAQFLNQQGIRPGLPASSLRLNFAHIHGGN